MHSGFAGTLLPPPTSFPPPAHSTRAPSASRSPRSLAEQQEEGWAVQAVTEL